MTLDTSTWQMVVQDVPTGLVVAFYLTDAHMGLGAPHYTVFADGSSFAVSALTEAGRNKLPHQQTGETVEHLVSLGWRAYSSVWVPKGHGPYEAEVNYEKYYPMVAGYPRLKPEEVVVDGEMVKDMPIWSGGALDGGEAADLRGAPPITDADMTRLKGYRHRARAGNTIEFYNRLITALGG